MTLKERNNFFTHIHPSIQFQYHLYLYRQSINLIILSTIKPALASQPDPEPGQVSPMRPLDLNGIELNTCITIRPHPTLRRVP